MDTSQTSMVAGVWATVVRALLLLLLGAGLQRLFSLLRTLKDRHRQRLAHVYVATALSFFVTYDLVVYGHFVNEFPYKMVPIGAGRFILDIVMALCIAIILRYGVSANVWSAGRKILIGLASWHLLAVLWHGMACTERSIEPPWKNYVPHLVVFSIYLSGYGIQARLRMSPEPRSRRFDQYFVIAVATVALVFSSYRLWQILR